MDSAVLFLIFNRPQTTEKVFEEIRKAKPPRLYIAADGPRENKLGEKELCETTRKIVENIDWDCEVKRLYRDKNLGCGIAVYKAIDWFFENEEEGLIIEDDILCHPDFFKFCDEMLKKYRNEDRVGMISGHNHLYGRYNPQESYGFMAIGHIWGWATWKRAWKDFEYSPLEKYPRVNFIKSLKKTFPKKSQRRFWEKIYTQVQNGVTHIWDYQWTISLITNKRYCLTSYKNLTKNIGFGKDATHVTSGPEEEINLELEPIYPLNHPKEINQDLKAEEIERINTGFFILPKNYIKSLFYRGINFVRRKISK